MLCTWCISTEGTYPLLSFRCGHQGWPCLLSWSRGCLGKSLFLWQKAGKPFQGRWAFPQEPGRVLRKACPGQVPWPKTTAPLPHLSSHGARLLQLLPREDRPGGMATPEGAVSQLEGLLEAKVGPSVTMGSVLETNQHQCPLPKRSMLPTPAKPSLPIPWAPAQCLVSSEPFIDRPAQEGSPLTAGSLYSRNRGLLGLV